MNIIGILAMEVGNQVFCLISKIKDKSKQISFGILIMDQAACDTNLNEVVLIQKPFTFKSG